MSRSLKRWILGALGAAAPFALIGLPVLAEQDAKHTGDLVRAKEMAAMIAQGQLNLRDATEIAERHVKGTALEAACSIQTIAGERRSQPPSEKELPSGRRLVYEVSCFAKDRVQPIRVDGLTKRVIEGDEPIGSGEPPSRP